MSHDQEMQALIRRARREFKWLYCREMEMWLSPDDAALYGKSGVIQLSAIHWTLRNPHDHLEQLKQVVVDAQRAVDEFQERMAK